MSALLSAHGLNAGHDDLAAVRNLDLEVGEGEIVALLGPNGAGKTTVIHTLAGWIPALGGEVRWQGEKIQLPLHRRARLGIALVPEQRAVFGTLSVRDNLRLGAGPVQAALDIFPELAALQSRRAGLCSGGEQQMLTLGRALAGSPRLLLADELSLGLAPLVVRRLMAAVRAAADGGTGVLLVEQHTESALEIADRAYVLRRGQVQFAGAAAEVRDRLRQDGGYLASLPQPGAGAVVSFNERSST